ncbi:MAG: hypothetical protein WCE90_04485 [Candidatus Zixiibacteriota bacterium]
MFKCCRVPLVLISLLCAVLSCSKSTKNETKTNHTGPPPLSVTPRENEEAELMALCLSGELVAPDSLYNQVVNDFAAIRANFGDTLPIVDSIKFMPPWAAGRLIIGFDTAAVRLFCHGEYHAWDTLNQRYEVTRIDSLAALHWIGLVLLRFRGRLHPYRLAEAYAVLPGVRAASPDGRIGDWPNVYAGQGDGGMTYLFRNGWGDCPSGCISSEYWYFAFAGNQPTFVGHWLPEQEHQVPEWWEEAKQNKEHYCGR